MSSTTLCLLIDLEYIIFGIGNLSSTPGFSDMYLILIVIPAGVAIVVTIMLFMSNSSYTLVLTPVFENLSFLLPVLIFVGCGILSVELRLIVVSASLVDICLLFESSQ